MPTITPPSSRPPRTTPAGSKPGALRVATPHRTRRPTLVALALVLILVGGTVAALVYLRATERSDVLAVARPVPIGHVISDADLITLSLSVDPRLRPLPASARRQVVGQVAATNLVPGTLLLRRMLTTSDALLQADEGLVGLAVKAGQLPEQLTPGDLVQVVRTPAAAGNGGAAAVQDDGAGGVLVGQAKVLSVSDPDDADTTRVSLIVPLADAAVLYRANATGELALVVLPSR